MTADERNFRKWFVGVLKPLRDNGNGGFFAFVSFPLLERYLREKSDVGQTASLSDRFYDELASLFPTLSGKRETSGIASK
jgi:hypothetical protein